VSLNGTARSRSAELGSGGRRTRALIEAGSVFCVENCSLCARVGRPPVSPPVSLPGLLAAWLAGWPAGARDGWRAGPAAVLAAALASAPAPTVVDWPHARKARESRRATGSKQVAGCNWRCNALAERKGHSSHLLSWPICCSCWPVCCCCCCCCRRSRHSNANSTGRHSIIIAQHSANRLITARRWTAQELS